MCQCICEKPKKSGRGDKLRGSFSLIAMKTITAFTVARKRINRVLVAADTSEML